VSASREASRELRQTGYLTGSSVAEQMLTRGAARLIIQFLREGRDR